LKAKADSTNFCRLDKLPDENVMKAKEEIGSATELTPNEGTPSLASLVTSYLRRQGFEVYRIQSTQEAYEIKGDDEVLRIYVTKKR